LTGEVVSEDEYSYAAAQKGNWVLYPKIPRYTIETPPYGRGRAEFDEDGKLCYWDDVKDIVRELEELRAAVRELEDLIELAGNAMRQANADGSEYEVEDELASAKLAVESYKKFCAEGAK
jgi:hypothetical protein